MGWLGWLGWLDSYWDDHISGIKKKTWTWNIPRKYGQIYDAFTYLHVLHPEIPIDILCLPGIFPPPLLFSSQKVRFSSI